MVQWYFRKTRPGQSEGGEQSLRSETVQQPGVDAVQLLLQLQANPELAAVVKGLLNTNLFG